MTWFRRLALTFLFLASSHPLLTAEEKKQEEPKDVSYYRNIRPIFQQHCQGCHQPAKAQGGFVMTSHAELVKPGDKGEPGIVAGKPDKSMIVSQISAHDGKKPAMPKGKDPLTEFEVNLIKKWITQGAKDDTPASAHQITVDMEHPPVYQVPPVINAVQFSPDGKLLAVSGYHEVLLHKADGSGLVARLVGLSERIQSLAFSPDGKSLAVTGGDPARFGEVQIWDIPKKRLALSHSISYDTVYGASWSSDGSKVAFGCADNTLRAIEAKTGKQVLFQGAHGDWVLDTTFSSDGNYVISVSRDMSMKMTHVETQRFIDNITSITPGALKGGLQTVALRPRQDPKRMSKVPPDTPEAKPQPYDEVLIGGSDGQPKIYKIHREAKRIIGDDFNKVTEFEMLPGRIFAGRFSPDGKRIVVGSSSDGKGDVRAYQVEGNKLICKFEGQKGPVYALAYRPDGKVVASAGFDGVVRLNDPNTGKLIKEFVPVPITKTVAATK